MIILKSVNMLFIHVPKTGGTSFQQAVLPHLGPDDVVLADDLGSSRDRIVGIWGEVAGKLNKHAVPLRIRTLLGADHYDRFCRVATVRNPFARAWSGFRFLRRRFGEKGILHADRTWDIRAMTFEDYLDSPLCGPSGRLASIPQTHWITSPADVDVLCRTETLDQDFQALAERLGGPLSAAGAIGKANESGDPEDWRHMSVAARDRILSIYAADFRAFDYPDVIT